MAINDGNTDAACLEVRSISKRFGGIQALEEVSLSVFPREIVGLVGANGAGKSTLINILAGVTKADSGEIYVDNAKVAINDPIDARRLGLEIVYQNLALIETLDIASNIHLGRELVQRPRLFQWLDEGQMRAQAQELLSSIGLDLNPKQLVRTLSGGQRQAVALARAIFFQAKIVLLDEPTAALGVAETQATLEIIQQFRDHGHGVMVVSHNLEDIFRITDRIVVMRAGRVVGVRSTRTTTSSEIVNLITMGIAEKAS
jgi:ABC-type sugar transport system ATPase subunit